MMHSFLLRFHRFLLSSLSAIAVLFVYRQWGSAAVSFIVVWVALTLARMAVNRVFERRNFRVHAEPFRRMFGPYGQKILSAAGHDRIIRQKLNEVFSPKRSMVEDSVKQLQFMSELARLGMRSTGTAAEAEELALAYGKSRLEKDDFTSHHPFRSFWGRRKRS